MVSVGAVSHGGTEIFRELSSRVLDLGRYR